MIKKGKDIKVGDLVPIINGVRDLIGVVTEVVGYKATVLVDEDLEVWVVSDLKKMAARKRAEV